MNRRNWLWVALLGLPMAVLGGLAYANNSQAKTFTCPLTGEELACSKCCPLNAPKAEGFTCPITGEQLPCEKCCPMNDGESTKVATKDADKSKATDAGYICPLSGEKLNCERCCPLNKK